MKPSRAQQALAGLAVLLVIAATLVGGALLALADNPATSARPTVTSASRPLPTQSSGSLLTITPAQPSPLPTITVAPTATTAPSLTPAPSATRRVPPPTQCSIMTGWVPYIVQPGDTLFTVGLQYNLTTDQLQAGNCLPGDRLATGQTIFVPPTAPRLTSTPPAAPTSAGLMPAGPTPAGPTPTSTGSDGICTNPSSTITWPGVGAVLTGRITFYGTATHAAFSFYKLEIRQEGTSGPGQFTTFYGQEQPVINGPLGNLDTAAFANGEYWIRLVVVDNTSNYPERCSILYTIQN